MAFTVNLVLLNCKASNWNGVLEDSSPFKDHAMVQTDDILLHYNQ